MISSGEELTKFHEGCTLVAVKDSVGWEIGYGRNDGTVRPGDTCTQEQADDWFTIDYVRAVQGAAGAVGTATWVRLNDARKAALSDMAFELGGHGLFGFHHMLDSISAEDWSAAQLEALDSLWAKQVPSRAARVAKMLMTGEWPDD